MHGNSLRPRVTVCQKVTTLRMWMMGPAGFGQRVKVTCIMGDEYGDGSYAYG